MHELSLVAELVEACERQAAGAPVTVVRVRRAATIPEAAVRAAFQALTTDGPLAGAVLEIEPQPVPLRCPCGATSLLGDADVIGGLAVCPSCGAVSPHEHRGELELVEVRSLPT